MQYLTAYGAPTDIGKLTKGDTILLETRDCGLSMSATQCRSRRPASAPTAFYFLACPRGDQSMKDDDDVSEANDEDEDTFDEDEDDFDGVDDQGVDDFDDEDEEDFDDEVKKT